MYVELKKSQEQWFQILIIAILNGPAK